jgi:putative acetyltransferase
MIAIRHEVPGDFADVFQINAQAFGQLNEAQLVDRLRNKVIPSISLVASSDSQIIGHIFFTPVTIESEETIFFALALGPMAVLPSFQHQGVGSKLVSRGLQECLSIGHPIVFVLGHPRFYSRFGFESAGPKGFQCQWAVPDDVFMIKELIEGTISARRGLVKYHPEFSKL